MDALSARMEENSGFNYQRDRKHWVGIIPNSLFYWSEENCHWKIEAHKSAAFCYFGEASLQPGIHVRHLNSNMWDIGRENLVLGSPLDNAHDKNSELKTGARPTIKSHGYVRTREQAHVNLERA